MLGAWILFMSGQSLDLGAYALAASGDHVSRRRLFRTSRAGGVDVGWGDGMFDNPFRFSDGFNRFLFALKLVLWPGRFVAECLADLGETRGREPVQAPGSRAQIVSATLIGDGP